jgi:hypothetical protein
MASTPEKSNPSPRLRHAVAPGMPVQNAQFRRQGIFEKERVTALEPRPKLMNNTLVVPPGGPDITGSNVPRGASVFVVLGSITSPIHERNSNRYLESTAFGKKLT